MKKELLKEFAIADIVPFDRNPRKNELAVNAVMKSIVANNYIAPIIIDEKNVIIVGHTRLKALIELGKDKCDVLQVTGLTEKQKKNYRILDNKTSEIAEWDIDLLKADFEVAELEEFGFDIKDLDQGEVVEDEAPQTPEIPKTVKGDLYELGNHRLLCGDSTIITDVEKLMDGQKADMVFTDPLYGVKYVGKTKEALTIKNDSDTNTFKESIAGIIQSLKAGGSIYVCCPPGNNFKDFLIPFDEAFYQSSTIIWNKHSMVMGHGDYHYKHEPILYGWQKDSKHTFYGDRTQTTVWDIARPTASKLHPTMKPIELIAKAIGNSSKGDDLLYEPFSGSGSTLIACEQTNRKCYGIELDERYCDVIVSRYVNFTKNTKIKLNGKEIEWPITENK